MARWSPVPFVIGPLNGGLPWPSGFKSELRREREWLTYLRGAYRLMPYYYSTYRRSAAILAAFEHTSADLPSSVRDRVIDFPEVGIDPQLFGACRERAPTERTTFLFVGRLVPYKCADVLVDAFARSEDLRNHRLVVVGDGPERGLLECAIRKHRLESCIELLGAKTQAQVAEIMCAADAFVFPSIRELGAGVVVEAMACGLPCVVVDYGGPGALISGEVGVKVRLGDKPSLARQFAAEMERLASAPELRARLGKAAARLALREYSWDAKARKVLRVYEWVTGQKSEKPVLRGAA